jgi:pimeloyl-ACP methyl ester carboxylesterase
MPDASLPIVLISGLTCSARLYAAQIPALWAFAPLTGADHRRDSNMAAIARRILGAVPLRFALTGLSMAGTGHPSTLEKPDAVNEALIEWMQW